jgi:NTE family protein
MLEDERIGIEGISGASAGAINAAVLANGVTGGGRDGGRRALKAFWNSVASKSPLDIAPDVPTREPGVAVSALECFSRYFSPHQLNPLDLNPLRDILAEQVDFERIRSDCGIKLFLSATQVATGKARIFTTADLSLEALLASACIPTLQRAIEIDGEAYWDGGLTANPPLQPLLYECRARDMLVVVLNPWRRPGVPSTAKEIRHRLAEISFGSALVSELQALVLAKKEAQRALLPIGRLDRRLRRLNLHLIDSQDVVGKLSAQSKFNTKAAFLEDLYKEGRARAGAWLRKNFRHIGERSSVALAEHTA